MKRMIKNIKIIPIDSEKVIIIKIYCIVCDKSRKFKNLKISYIFLKILGISIVCSKCGNECKPNI